MIVRENEFIENFIYDTAYEQEKITLKAREVK